MVSAFADDLLGLGRFLAAAVDQGVRPFALASVDGGNTYWHARRTGEDAGGMVLHEFLPLLARHGLDVRHVGFLGWSMGGYGALSLAARLGEGRVAAVAAESPALWHDFADTAPGAFDGPADFAAATVFGRQAALAGIPVRIDSGQGDPFYPAVPRLRRRLPGAPGWRLSTGRPRPRLLATHGPRTVTFLARGFNTTG